jgi:hypothetical protein
VSFTFSWMVAGLRQRLCSPLLIGSSTSPAPILFPLSPYLCNDSSALGTLQVRDQGGGQRPFFQQANDIPSRIPSADLPTDRRRAPAVSFAESSQALDGGRGTGSSSEAKAHAHADAAIHFSRRSEV